MKTLCIYHENCPDGFGAAWAVRKAFPNAEFFAASHIDPAVPDTLKDRKVVIVDYCYHADVTEKIAKEAESVIILDHHESSIQRVAGFRKFAINAPAFGPVAACIDQSHSGAMLAWKFFFPGAQPPKLLAHIEDYDLNRFAIDGTREIVTALMSYPYDFGEWSVLMQSDLDVMRDDGAAIQRKRMKDLRQLVPAIVQRMTIGGYNVPVVNLPYTLARDACHMLLQARSEPFAASYYETRRGRTFSLHSLPGGVNVAETAAIYGGGGHKDAAGFSVPKGASDPA